MKKIFLAVAAFACLLVPIQAQAADGMFGSPYVGFYGGMGFTSDSTADLDGADYGGFVGFKLDSLLGDRLGANGPYLSGAFELHYGLSGAEEKISSGAFAGVTLEKDQEFGLSFRPGLSFLNKSAKFNLNPYGIIGYRRTSYEASAGGSAAEGDYDGFELGLGAELVAYENWVMRAEYSHIFYGDEGGVFDPSEDTFRLGVAYKF